jgi:Anion-transporting ATPase
MTEEEAQLPDPSLKNVLDQETLQWVFVGGKGGVGKTTTSCCLGIQLAMTRKKVSLERTDDSVWNPLLVLSIRMISFLFLLNRAAYAQALACLFGSASAK